MQLIPFDPRFAELVLPYYCDPAYAHWARGVRGYLTVQQCERLPEIFQSEFLHVLDDDQIIGLVRLKEESEEIFGIGLAINKTLHGQGLAKEIVRLAGDYVLNKKRGRMMLSFTVDDWIGEHWKSEGWIQCGEIPEYNFLNGNYVNAKIFYKKLK